VEDEDGELDPNPVTNSRQTIAAIRRLEESVVGASWLEGIVLRYGGFYGPGTSLAEGGEMLEPGPHSRKAERCSSRCAGDSSPLSAAALG
jgi:hypothetical protein